MSGLFTNQGTSIFSGCRTGRSVKFQQTAAGTATFNTDAGSSAVTLSVNATAGTINFASTQHLLALNISSGALVKLTANGSATVLVTSQLSDAGIWI